jgi:serine/threonine-protein kinase
MPEPIPTVLTPAPAADDPSVIPSTRTSVEGLPDAMPDRLPPPPPRVDVPGYEIVEVLGRGGMGVVYKARQIALDRFVALKMIRAPGSADAEERGRFHTEALAVARLTHPNIVQVYEVGEHDGVPFLALEFVDGGSLAQQLARGPLPAAVAACLTEALARAVQHAHEQGIIHRDLKPANVLLALPSTFSRGSENREALARFSEPRLNEDSIVPKITDFGLAKRLDIDQKQTQSGAILGTPSYMAPEQAAGKVHDIGPATDVYALGAVLYEMLTGKPPFQAPSTYETLQQVMADEPVSVRRLQPKVPRDLETICHKCLHKEPRRRYTSARELADDLQRYLAGEPIRARPVTLVEGLWKWARRRPTQAASTGLAGLLLLVLLAGVSLFAWQADQRRQLAEEHARAEEHLREEAERNLTLARKAVDDCFNVARDNALFQRPRMEQPKKLLLEKTLPFYRQFRSRRPGDRGLQREEAIQWFRVAYIEHVLGHFPEALAAYQRGTDLSDQLFRAAPHVPEYQKDLAAAHGNLGNLLFAWGRWQQALVEQQRSGDLLRKLVEAHPNVPEYQNNLAVVHNNLGNLLSTLGESEQALKEYRQACDLRIRLIRAHPRVPEYRNDLAGSQNNLAKLLAATGKRQEATKEFLRARSLLSQLVKSHPRVPGYQSSLAIIHNNLARLLVGLGQDKQALTEYTQARSLQVALVRTHPDLPDYQNELASTHTNLASLLESLGKRDEALKEFEQARDLLDKLVAAHPHTAEYRKNLALNRNSLGWLLAGQGRRPEALREYLRGREVWLALTTAHPDLPENQNERARTHHNLGNLLDELGRRDEAVKEFDLARSLRVRLVRAQPRSADYLSALADTCLERGGLLLRLSQLDDSLVDLNEALRRTDELYQIEPTHSQVPRLLNGVLPKRAAVLTRLGRLREADRDWDRALKQAPSEQRSLRLQRADSRARAGDYRRAAAEAGELGRGWFLSAATLYDLGCVHALSAASASRDSTRPLPEREKRAEQWAHQAVALLKRAASRGFFREPAGVTHLDRDSDLAFLRDRDDYQRFRAGLNRRVP